jgi:hypothetical protein
MVLEKKLVLSVEFVHVHSRSNLENWKMKGLSLKRLKPENEWYFT